MSKKHGARRKRRRKRAAVICPACHAPAGSSPEAALTALAAVLNACDDAGARIRFRHGAAYSPAGIVLPPLQKGQRWVARTLAYAPLSLPVDEVGDDLDG